MAGNTKGGSIIVPLTSCLTGLDESVTLLANISSAVKNIQGTGKLVGHLSISRMAFT